MMFWGTLVSFIILCALSTLNFLFALKEFEKNTYQKLHGIAKTLAYNIDGDLHEAISTTYKTKDAILTRDQDSIFNLLSNELETIQKLNFLNTPIYSLIKTSEGTEFILTSSPKPYYRHPYVYWPEMDAVFDKGHSSQRPIYKEDHGEWLSVYAPIKNSKGDVVAVLEVDENISDIFKAYLNKFLLTLGILIGIALVLLLIMYRLAKSITGPLKSLEQQATYIKNSDYSKPINISSKDEVGNLSLILEDARVQISGFVERILASHPDLLFSINLDGTVQPQYSSKTQEVFGDIEGKPISALSSEFTNIKETLLLLNQPGIEWQVIKDLYLNQISIAKTTYKFSYTPITHKGNIVGLLINASDITKEIWLAEDLERQTSYNTQMMSILGDAFSYNLMKDEFLNSWNRALELIEYPSNHIEELFRIVHTFKGSAASFDLKHLTTLSHELESKLDSLRTNPDKIDGNMQKDFQKILSEFNEVDNEVTRIMGKQNEDIMFITPAEIKSLKDLYDGSSKIDKVINKFKLPLTKEFIERKVVSIFKSAMEEVDDKDIRLKFA